MVSGVEEQAAIVVKRRTIIQDLVRSYTVFIDGTDRGKVWAFQSKRFDVQPGDHSLRLAIIRTGTASSDDLKLSIAPGQTLTVRTHGRGLKNLIVLPIILGPGAAAQRRSEPLDHPRYDRPWIKTRVELTGEGN